MKTDIEKEIDLLKKEMAEIKEKLVTQVAMAKDKTEKIAKIFYPKENSEKAYEGNNETKVARIVKNIHPDKRLDDKLSELCQKTKDKGNSGFVSHMGIFYSNNRQHNWVSSDINIDDLMNLIESKMAEKVLSCIGNSDRLNILLAILKRPMSVAELINECNFNTTGQAYHHMKPLLAADLIVEDSNNKGIYVVQPHKVQGIIMLLAGIRDMLDETYSKGNK